MHVASIGAGPRAILFVHGFPELWYTWRHQLLSLSSLGYRCIAPDLRGYGDTDSPGPAAQYTSFHVVGDLVGLLDGLRIQQVFLVGHDWGAIISWHFCLLRPDREAGEMEAEFAGMDTGKVLMKFLGYRDPNPPCIPKETGFVGFPDPPTLPSWISQEDVDYYAAKYDKSGFTGPLNYYRSIDLTWEMMGPWTGAKVVVPTKFIVGELDLTLKLPGAEAYINNGGFKKDVPLLEDIVVLKGVGHFLNEEKPEEVTKQIHDFFNQF
ncbi:unnamed protein product [Linum tenue]|uniref:AB hydrolase-1 domain-containing protein n=1 Tax=Linum tenue TaxID=586396 RepID=A0AAV0KG73_9ROSI|nr:unnamed protein product [Linum tenue]